MRVIQAGLGHFGKSWSHLVRDAPGCTLEAVVDPSPTWQAWATTELRMQQALVFARLEEALSACACDAVLVVTPPETHLDIATVALRAGKHVLTEKPLTPGLAEATRVIAEAERAERIVMVSQNYRFRAQARLIRDLIAADAIGTLVSVRIDCQRDMRPTYEPTNFRYSMRHPYVIDMSIHHVDLIRALTGQEVTSIFARSWRVPNSPYLHDPAMAALLTLEGGAAVHYEGSGATYRPWTSWNGDWELAGERGRITWTGGVENPDNGIVTMQHWGKSVEVMPLPAGAIIDRPAVLQAFRLAVESGQEPETSARDNIKSLALVIGFAESIDRAEPVRVADVLSFERVALSG